MVVEAWTPGQTFDALANSGKERCCFMDLKLSAVLTTMIKGTPAARVLYDDITVREQEAAKANSMLKGRQILFMVLIFFKTNRQMEFVYGIEDLTAHPWLCDRDLHQFRHKWNAVTESIADKLSTDTLANI